MTWLAAEETMAQLSWPVVALPQQSSVTATQMPEMVPARRIYLCTLAHSVASQLVVVSWVGSGWRRYFIQVGCCWRVTYHSNKTCSILTSRRVTPH